MSHLVPVFFVGVGAHIDDQQASAWLQHALHFGQCAAGGGDVVQYQQHDCHIE